MMQNQNVTSNSAVQNDFYAHVDLHLYIPFIFLSKFEGFTSHWLKQILSTNQKR